MIIAFDLMQKVLGLSLRLCVDFAAHNQALAFLFQGRQLVLILDLLIEEILPLPSHLLVRQVVDIDLYIWMVHYLLIQIQIVFYVDL